MEIQAQMMGLAEQQDALMVQTDMKTRELRKTQLTIEEINALPDGTNCYLSVGRMYVLVWDSVVN